MVRIIPFLLFVLITGCTGHSLRHENAASRPVAVKSLIDLGGVKQYVEMTGESDGNPVMLFIHGGPGWPQTPMLRYFNSGLYKNFTLVTWDQRGCGLSFMSDSMPPNMSLEQIVADAHELTQKIKKQFKQEKVYLVGYSWGSIIGVTLAQKYPGDYHAYAGVSQVINLRKGMEVTQDWIKQKAEAEKNDSIMQVLVKLKAKDPALCKSDLECFLVQYGLVSLYKGNIFSDSSERLVEKAQGLYDDYKKYDWGKGFIFSASKLEKDMFSTDLTGINKLDIPVYLLEGRHDWNVPAVLADDWLKQLNAPRKEIIWFEQSGHDALEEEPELFNRVLIEKLLTKK